jgi:hypothetical protein
MAVSIKLETIHGETRELYVRLNNIESNNHGQPSIALFRGFLSEQAFRDGRHYLFEELVEVDADVSLPLWQQAYDALRARYPDAVDC